MKTTGKGFWIRLAFLSFAMLLTASASAQFGTAESLAEHYLQRRPEMAPLIPPLQPSILNTLESMIRKGDYSFQEWEDWYAGWSESECAAFGELAEYAGQTLIVYEDLSVPPSRS